GSQTGDGFVYHVANDLAYAQDLIDHSDSLSNEGIATLGVVLGPGLALFHSLGLGDREQLLFPALPASDEPVLQDPRGIALGPLEAASKVHEPGPDCIVTVGG